MGGTRRPHLTPSLLAIAAVVSGGCGVDGADAREADRPIVPAAERLAAAGTVWRDDFSGSAGARPDADAWTPRLGGRWGNGTELQSYTYRPENLSLDGRGRLQITARREAYTGEDEVAREFTSARIDTATLHDFRYGRLSARIKVPTGSGLLPAFWALPQSFADTGVDGGELDVAEVDGRRPRAVLGSVHLPDDRDGQAHLNHRRTLTRSLGRGFHTYTLDWTRNRLTWRIDGEVYATRSRAEVERAGRWVFDEPYFLVLNVAVGNPASGRPQDATPFPATMLVDWVRVERLRKR